MERHTIKPETPEHRTTEHGTPAEHWQNIGTLAKQRNTGETMEIPWNSGT